MTASSASPPPSAVTDTSANDNIQPFYLLHKASSSSSSSSRNSGRKSAAARRIDLSPSKPSNNPQFDSHKAFHSVWSKIDSAIKGVLRDVNNNVFNEIHTWVRQSFLAITSSGLPSFAEATRPLPILNHATSKQLFTGLVLIKNMEFVDDLLTFEELGLCLKSHGCHVANLSSRDFATKNGVGGCLRSLLRQFLLVTLDAADISILASWYREHGNHDSPVVIIIDDMERCSRSVLSDFILMLSEWVVKIPMILIMGITTLDAPRNVLPSHVLQQLCPSKFILASPAERMNAVVEAALVRWCSGFSIGHKVAVFLKNYFLNHDGTLTSFIRALKIACAQHFSMEPLSSTLGLIAEEGSDYEGQGPDFSSGIAAQIDSNLACGLTELKRSQKCWGTVVMCLYEAGKYNKVQLLDLFCEALDPNIYNAIATGAHTRSGKGFEISSSNQSVAQQYWRKGGPISQVIQKVRDLPAASLSQLLKSWENLTVDILEIHDKVKELQPMIKIEDGSSLKQDFTDLAKRHTSRTAANIKELKTINEKAANLITSMIRDFMKPIECIPFHEVVCFKDVEKLQLALNGDPRRRIQVDLLEFHKFLQCKCCSRTGNVPLSSMPDTSIMYTLAQEHGDLISLHDWYQCFKTVMTNPSVKVKRKGKQQSPLPKKRKETNENENKSESSIQARFCKAVTEMQITGLIRMPTKRRPDCVQRVAFGL
ncbi:origin of replication complex subunit 3 isoform X2 [Humulus lupulus]|uniref:origin of replication complex subunit 3 isoform X2 n=1 Tax=Humulus lupulus TaxID=3486 RepID=UPI002B417361|nr:origin of replication complex subunit 3 isoform X2 [Humulus lupulus]